MTNAKLNVLLATVLDKAAHDRALASRIMKRYALVQALAVEEQLSEEDTLIVSAAATLYELNDETVNPEDDGKEFSPIVITDYIKELLEELYVPVFEASAIGSLVAMQKHGLSIENDLHRLLVDVNLLVTLDEENAGIDRVKEAGAALTHASAKRRLALMFGLEAAE